MIPCRPASLPVMTLTGAIAGMPDEALLDVLRQYAGQLEWAGALFQPQPAQTTQLLQHLLLKGPPAAIPSLSKHCSSLQPGPCETRPGTEHTQSSARLSSIPEDRLAGSSDATHEWLIACKNLTMQFSWEQICSDGDSQMLTGVASLTLQALEGIAARAAASSSALECCTTLCQVLTTGWAEQEMHLCTIASL